MAPYLPTPGRWLNDLLAFAEVKPDDTVADVGCGDGRVPIMAVHAFNAKCVPFHPVAAAGRPSHRPPHPAPPLHPSTPGVGLGLKSMPSLSINAMPASAAAWAIFRSVLPFTTWTPQRWQRMILCSLK